MRQLLLYCLCGGLGVATDYLAFWLAVTAGLWYQGANLLGYLAGTLVSFALNRVVTFGMRDRVAQRLARFVGVAALGFGASALLLWLLVQQLGLDARLAKLLTLPMVVALQFTLNRRLTFNAALPTRTGPP
ncbi:MAG: GtrA family protein [Duganella sp.]